MPDQGTFSHILFDLDHTLTFYPLSTAGVVAETFARLGLPLAPLGSADELARRYDALWVALQRDARTIDELRLAVWRRLLAEAGGSPDGQAEKVATAYGIVRRENGARLIDGVPNLLSELRAAGYGLGLLTNGEPYAQWETIRSLGVEPLFDVVLVAGDIGLYKPDPRAFAVLLDRLGASPEAALFVGDSYEADVMGAHAAGIRSAWIRPAETPRPGAVAPEYEISSVLDVRGIALGDGR